MADAPYITRCDLTTHTAALTSQSTHPVHLRARDGCLGS
jgi:hypothetical protein